MGRAEQALLLLEKVGELVELQQDISKRVEELTSLHVPAVTAKQQKRPVASQGATR